MKKKLTFLLCLMVLFIATSLISTFASPLPVKPKAPKVLITYYAIVGTAYDNGPDPLIPGYHSYTFTGIFGSGSSISPPNWVEGAAPVDITATVELYDTSTYSFTLPAGESRYSITDSFPPGSAAWKIISVSPLTIGGIGVHMDSTGSSGTSTHYLNYTPPSGW